MSTITEEVGAVEAHDDEAQNGQGPEPEERRTLADLASQDPDQEEIPDQFTLFGTAPRITGSMKKARPTHSAVKFKAAAQELPGQFDIDDVIEMRVIARVDNLSFPTKRDGDGKLIRTTRTHHMTLVTLEQVGDVDPAFAGIDARSDRLQEVLSVLDQYDVPSTAREAVEAILSGKQPATA